MIVKSVKRIIGLRASDINIPKLTRETFYKIKDVEGTPYISIGSTNGNEKLFLPEQISAMILGKIKINAENYIGKKIRNVVITIPARFSQTQRSATIAAAKIAGDKQIFNNNKLGLNPIYLLTEPTAVALAYGTIVNSNNEENIMVIDFGGGTLDISIVQKANNGSLQVIATEGDVSLGGEDITKQIYEELLLEWEDNMDKVAPSRKQTAHLKIWKAVQRVYYVINW